MSKASSAMLHMIRTMTGAYRQDSRSDEELLSRYTQTHDENAFATLVVRHGPMVWGVCSRILGNTQDVEDACQVVLLALANEPKNSKIKSVPGWLHEVARRTALHARKTRNGRKRLQERLKAISEPAAASERSSEDAHELLHQELVKLPEKLRTALVLHYLEGKTEVEVAQILGVAKEAIYMRMSRARSLLQKRLSRRGLTVGAAALGTLLAQSSSYNAMPPGLVVKALHTAKAFHEDALTGGLAQLAKEILKQASTGTPWWKTGWMIMTILCLGGVGVGTGGIAWKAGFFGTNAEAPVSPPKGESSALAEKNEPKKPRLDRYGDPLPSGALVRLGTLRLRHAVGDGHSVASVQFTPDGKSIMTAGHYNPPRLWDVATGKLLRRFGNFPDELTVAAALSPDGRFLANRFGGGRNPNAQNQGFGNIYVWETATGKLVREFEGDPQDQSDLCCSFSPDGRTIAARLQNKFGRWDVATGKELWSREDKGVGIITFSPDGKVIASGNRIKGGALISDAATGRKISEITASGGVRAIAFPSNGDAVLVETVNEKTHLSTLTMWDLRAGKARWTREDLNFLVLSPDGKTVIVKEPVSRHLLLDGLTGKDVRRLWAPVGGYGTPAVYSADGRVIAALSTSIHGSVIRFWDSATFQELPTPDLEGHRDAANTACFMPDGDTLVTGGADGSVRFWNAGTGRERQRIWSDEKRQGSFLHEISPAMSPNGKILAVNFAEAPASEKHANIFEFQEACRSPIRFWDAAAGKELQRISVKGETANLVYSSDGKWLSAAIRIFRPISSNTHVWNAATGKELNHVFPGTPIWLSNNGHLVTATFTSHETNLQFWNIETGKRVHEEEIASHCTPVISPDGRMVVGAIRPNPPGVALKDDAPGKLSIYPLSWKSTSARVVIGTPRELECTGSEGWWALLEFSPDNRILALCARGASNAVIRLLEVCSGKERARFSGHLGPVTTLCFAPDGKKLVTGSNDSTLLVWDVTGRLQEDGKLRSAQHNPKALEKLWDELASRDASCAGRAVWAMTAIGHPAVDAIAKRLTPTEAAPAELVRQLIVKLDSHDFRTRKGAQETLRKLVDRLAVQCKPLLDEAFDNHPSVETRRTLKDLLAIVDEKSNNPPAELLRGLRSLEVLEHVGTPDAVRLLQKCAAGEYDGRLTDDARRTLNRLEQTRRLKNEQSAVAQKFQS